MQIITGVTSSGGVETLQGAFVAVERAANAQGGRLAVGGLTERNILQLIWKLQNRDNNSAAALEEILAKVNVNRFVTQPVAIEEFKNYLSSLKVQGSIVEVPEEKYRLTHVGVLRLDYHEIPPIEYGTSDLDNGQLSLF